VLPLKGYLTVFRESVEKMQVLFEYNKNNGYFTIIRVYICGPGSSVGTATDYGLDGAESNPGGDENFRPSRPERGLTQPPVKRVPGLSRR